MGGGERSKGKADKLVELVLVLLLFVDERVMESIFFFVFFIQNAPFGYDFNEDETDGHGERFEFQVMMDGRVVVLTVVAILAFLFS